MFKFIRASYQRQLLLCFLIVAVLPLVLGNVFMVKAFQTRIRSDYKKEALEQLSSVENELKVLIGRLESISVILSENRNVIETLYVKDSMQKKEMYQELYNITSDLREYAQFDLYSIGGVCKYSTNDDTLGTKLPTYWGILRAASMTMNEFIVQRAFTSQNNDQGALLTTCRAINDGRDNCIGFIVISIDATGFESLLKGTYNSLNSITIMDHYWHTIYSTEEKEEFIVPLLRERLLKGEALNELREDYQYYITPIADTQLFAIMGQRELFTQDMTKTMYQLCSLMAGASLVLCFIVSLVLTKNLTKPLNHLTKAMHEVEQGNLKVTVDETRTDEIGRLANNFNSMAKELQDYMIRQVRQQKELNEANIAMMQAQLNPHFLYNTLDTMKWVAKANHIPEIATLSSSLAKILRLSISEAQFIRIQEELAVVKSYVDIQRIRFSDKFTYQVNLPEDLKDCIVPKLLVQPLVENAIIHGLADRDYGHIMVNVMEDKDQLLIEVSDDGCGMSEEIMEHLNSMDRSQLKGHLGFYNVDTIVRLHYGKEYGLHASAIDSGGTKVTVNLPLRKEEIYDKSTYC